MNQKYFLPLLAILWVSCQNAEPKKTETGEPSGDTASVLKDIPLIPPTDTTDPAVYANYLFRLSEQQEQKGDTTGAIGTLEKLVQPGELTQASLRLANLYAATLNPKTLNFCNEILAANQERNAPEPYYFKGVYYDNMGQPDKALKAFDASIQSDYNFIDAYLEKGRILYKQKKYNEALKVYQLALTVSNSFADTYYWMGLCQEALGQKEEALLNYKRAYGLDKTLKEAKDAADKLSQ